MTRPDIQAIGAKWIAAFRLQGLRIAFGYVRNLAHPDTGNPVYALMSELNSDEGSYRIEIQDPDTWPKNAPRPPTQKTIENAFRHECLHIRVRDFAKSNPSEADIIAEERAVWAISDAFDLVADNAVPHVAAMAMSMLAQGPKQFSNVAAMVRAMAVQPAALRRQTTGNKSMDVLDLVLAALAAALTAENPKAAIEALLSEVKALKDKGVAAPDGVPSPMPQDAGDEYGKDKPPMAMGDEKKPDQMMRAMKAQFEAKLAEMETALVAIRPAAKAELVRGMHAEGIPLTKAAEDEITNAPTLDVAKERAKGMRAMAPAGTKRTQALPPTGDAVGLTRAQSATYNRMLASGNPGADTYRNECVKANDAAKGGAK